MYWYIYLKILGKTKQEVKVRLPLNSEMFVFYVESNYFILYMYTFIILYYVLPSQWRSTTSYYVHNETSIIRNILTLDICTNIQYKFCQSEGCIQKNLNFFLNSMILFHFKNHFSNKTLCGFKSNV